MSTPQPPTRSPEREPQPDRPTPPGAVPPHAPLTRYYGEVDRRERYVMDLFNRTAKYYNTVEALFGNGGIWYRRFSLRRAGLRPGMQVLDVAMGTAAVARGAARLVGPKGWVVGVDPNPAMLAEAGKVFGGPRVRGVGQALPIASGRFDFVTMGIALRHVSDLVATFREYRRVLKPGGKLWILEGHVPASKLGHGLTRFVWARVIPGMTLLATRSREAKELMDYYWDTVDQAVDPDTILRCLGEAGFENARFKVVVPGAFCEYTATNPLPAS
jgi:demethylmenaquinone methyltransferase/2-methoxy-6-polyprenyl-1,4-benzoquinol methylase